MAVTNAPYFAANLTGQWAYFDPDMVVMPVVFGPAGLSLRQNFFNLWLTDRDANPAYRSPDFYTCLLPPDPSVAGLPPPPGLLRCGDLPLFKSARTGLPPELAREVLSTDPSGAGNWQVLDVRRFLAQLSSVRLPAPVGFANGMQLIGLDPHAPAPRSGQTVQLSLVWQGVNHIDFDYSAFLRLDDGHGHSYSGADHEPGIDQGLPLPSWQPGLLVRDGWNVTLPADAPAGEYDVQVGLYNYQTMAPVKTLDGADRATIGAMRVEQ